MALDVNVLKDRAGKAFKSFSPQQLIMLGLLASAVAVICERHLEARIRRTAAV